MVGFLRFLNYFLAKKMEFFFPKIGLDLIDGHQEDLIKVDIWQLCMTLSCSINPGLNAPFDTEFD